MTRTVATLMRDDLGTPGPTSSFRVTQKSQEDPRERRKRELGPTWDPQLTRWTDIPCQEILKLLQHREATPLEAAVTRNTNDPSHINLQGRETAADMHMLHEFSATHRRFPSVCIPNLLSIRHCGSVLRLP